VDKIRIAFAGDRWIAVEVLRYILSKGVSPEALILPASSVASHSPALRSLCPQLPEQRVFTGKSVTTPHALAELRGLHLDYLISVHYPTLFPQAVLDVASVAPLNLLPAYLPFSRCWHKAAWAMLNRTPYGATLHVMTSRPDAGDIVHQRELEILPEDTAHTAYSRAVQLELVVFQEAWTSLCARAFRRTPQDEKVATSHRASDIRETGVQLLEPNAHMVAGDVLNRLRALTTNRTEEAAYFVEAGCRYRVQVHITPEVAD